MSDKDQDYWLEYDLEHKDELAALYHRVDQEVEKSKGRRFMLVWAGHILAPLTLVFRLLLELDVLGILSSILVCAMLGSVLFWIEFGAFEWMISHNREDHERRERIIERIQKVAAEEKRNPKRR